MIDRFDTWLAPEGPVALTIVESYIPVTGRSSVFFPPTFAPEEDSKDKKSSYVIDHGVCIVDTIGSQANRIEPIFKRHPYSALVPQISVLVGKRSVNLLDAGHRAADAVVRFSPLWPVLREAFLSYREKGRSDLLAKIAPTSLVFGVWDSRDTQAKLPRLLASSVSAFGASPLKRAAQYVSAIEEDTRRDMGIDSKSLQDKAFPAEFGLVDNPSGRVPGGVIANQGIKREAYINLVALRSLTAGSSEDTVGLRRYILGLTLIAFLAPIDLYLRQGCLLCQDPGIPPLRKETRRDGTSSDLTLSSDEALKFAQEASAEFGVGESRETMFDAKLVKVALGEKKALAAKKKASI